MSKTINIDMDGVLVDFSGPALALFEVENTDPRRWDGLPEAAGVTTKEFWLRVFDQTSSWWALLPWAEKGREVLALCESFEIDISVMTSPSGPASAAGKMMWLQREAPSVAASITVTKEKYKQAGPDKFLIDDANHNVLQFVAHGGVSFLWPQKWNKKERKPQRLDLAELHDRILRWASGTR